MYGYGYSPFSFLSGLSNFCCLVFWVLLIAVVVLVLVRIFSVNKYSEESVIERWGALLTGQADKADVYLKYFEEATKSRGLPWTPQRERIATSLTSSDYQDFSVCRLSSDYSAFTSCIPAGSDLHVTWLVQDHMIRGLYKLPIIGPLLLSVMKRYSFAMMNKVNAFASATYSCAVQAAERILQEANQDVSKLNRQTSGKLGPL